MAEMASPLKRDQQSPKMNNELKLRPKMPNTIVKGPIYNKLATRVYMSK